jgi:uncharacterized phiE125 gp8 family phage protein
MLTRIKTTDILPVGLGEVKAHLRLDHAHEDEHLTLLMQAAAGFVEEYLGRSLLIQTWRKVWKQPKPHPPQLSTSPDEVGSVELAYPPLRQILSVQRLMPSGEKRPIRRHRLEVNHQVPRLFFAEVPEPVEIEFETGYGESPTDIPPLIRQAILMTVADFYEYRDSGSVPRNSFIWEILDSYRIVRLP